MAPAHWLSDGARIGPDGTVHDPADPPEQRLQRTLRVGQGLWAAMPAVAAATSRRTAVQAVGYARRRRTREQPRPRGAAAHVPHQQTVVLGALADAFALTCAADGALAVRTEGRSAAPPGPEGGEEKMGFTPWAAVSQPLAAYKAVTVRTAARLTAECQHRCGFSGHLTANRLAAYQGFHHAFDTAGGDSQLIFYDIGRSLVESLDEREQRQEQLPTPPPLVARPPPPPSARSRTGVAGGAAGRIPASDPFERWNPLLEQAGLLGEVRATLLVADDVTRVLGRLRDQGLVRALTPLAALHGVLSARRLSGSLLALGTLEPADMAALSEATDRLCEAVMEQLPLLVEVFDEYGDRPGVAPAPPAAALTWTLGSAS
ncbi:hypothetical protein SMICM17S_03089 [Streptomyces microflavus]